MLSKLLYFCFLFTNICYGQILNEKYISYSEKDIEFYFLQFTEDTLQISVPQRKGSLFPEMNYYFMYKKCRDTIKIREIKTQSNRGINVSSNLSKKFSKKNILIYSKNEIRLANNNQSYFRKQYVDSLTEGKPIVVFDNTIYKHSDSLKLQKKYRRFSSNKIKKKLNKKYKISILKGKKAYEKYGILGLYGVIEYNPKKTTTNNGYK